MKKKLIPFNNPIDAVAPLSSNLKTSFVPVSISEMLSSSICPFAAHDFDSGYIQFAKVLIRFADVPFTSSVLSSYTSFVVQKFSLDRTVKCCTSTFVFLPSSNSHGTISILISLSERLSVSSPKDYAIDGLKPSFHLVPKKNLGLRFILLNFNGTNPPTHEYFITNYSSRFLNTIVILDNKR